MKKSPYNYACRLDLIKHFNLIFFTLYIFTTTFAQSFNCANEVIHTHQLKDTTFVQQLKSIYHTNNTILERNANTILEIPIAVHVLHRGEAIGVGSNIADQKIYDAIDAANKQWSNTFVTNNALGNDVEVQFCLAQFDPNGNPSTGINRVDASAIPNYLTVGIGYIGAILNGIFGSDELQTKNLSNWRHDHVLNVWVVHRIAGNWGGYASFPLPNGDYATDGVVIIDDLMNGFFFTLAHELGHAMGLFHTFQGDDNGCPANDFCFIQGDWICDTPPHRQRDCSQTTCNNNPDSILSFRNIMSYCSNEYIFTKNQKERIRNTILTSSRKALLNSTACTGIVNAIPTSKQEKERIRIYPNPTKQDFMIEFPININEEVQVQLINILGEVVYSSYLNSGLTHPIHINQKLPSGLYHLQLKNKEDIVESTKIIIQ